MKKFGSYSHFEAKVKYFQKLMKEEEKTLVEVHTSLFTIKVALTKATKTLKTPKKMIKICGPL